jgi:DNA invertase Pin-like site-specific DNA recombinase
MQIGWCEALTRSYFVLISEKIRTDIAMKPKSSKEKRQVELTKAVAYFRTSSAANVGPEKDSERRQREAVRSFAKRAEFEVADEFYDAAVSGTDAIEARPGFSALLDRIEGNGVRTVLVEDASRLARSVLVQELAILALKARGVRVLASNGDDLTETDDEMKVAMRQIAGAFAQLEKTRLVKKLRAARERKRATGVKVEGRKRIVERENGDVVVAEAKRLRRRSPKTGQRLSLREIAGELARQGYVSASGHPFSSSVVKSMVER